MATDTEELEEASKWSPWAIAAAVLLLLMFGMIAVGTVRGCFTVDPKEQAKLEAEKKKLAAEKEKKREFDIEFPVVQPSEPESPIQPVKPGHWAATSQKMRANFRDFVG